MKKHIKTLIVIGVIFTFNLASASRHGIGIRNSMFNMDSRMFQEVEYAERILPGSPDLLYNINKVYPLSSNPKYIEYKHQVLQRESFKILNFTSDNYGAAINLSQHNVIFSNWSVGQKTVDLSKYRDDLLPHVALFILGDPTILYIDDYEIIGIKWYPGNITLNNFHLCSGFYHYPCRFYYLTIKDADGNLLGDYRPFWNVKEKKVVILDLCDLYDQEGNVKQYNYSNPALIIPGPKTGFGF